MCNITDDTPLSFLTVRDLRDLLSEAVTPKPRRYVKGLAGLAELLHVSRMQAWRIKNSGVIDAAVSQAKDGASIVIDADLALQLYSGYSKKGGVRAQPGGRKSSADA